MKICKVNIFVGTVVFLICFCFTACSSQRYVSLCDYRNIKIPKETAIVSDEDVKLSVRMQLLEKKAYLPKETNQNIIETDDVVDLLISDNQQYKEKMTVIIGADEFLEGFDELLLGKKTGETYNVSFQGEEYEITIFSVGQLAEEITDELATHYFNYETAQQVIDNTRAEIIRQREIDYLYMYILNESMVRISNTSRDSYVQNRISKLSEKATFADQSIEVYVQEEFDMTLNEYKESIISFYDELLILEEFLKNENAAVSQDEFQKYVEEFATQNGIESEEVIESYSEEVIRYEMYYEKAQNLLAKYINY